MTHSALSSRSVGMSSGISRISLRTVPQLSRRSASFWSSAAESGRAAIANAITQEIILLITVSPRRSFLGQGHHRVPVGWAQPWAQETGPRDRAWFRGLFVEWDAQGTEWVAFRLYFSRATYERVKNENRQNFAAMCGGSSGGRRVGLREWGLPPRGAKEKKKSGRRLRRQDTNRGLGEDPPEELRPQWTV